MTANTYYICATQISNLGDLVINKVLIDELCNYGKMYLDAHNIPDDFKAPLFRNANVVDVSKRDLTVKSLSVCNIFRFIKLIRKEKIKLITRSPGPLVDPTERIRYGFSLINIIGRILGAKVVYFGNCCSKEKSKRAIMKSTRQNAVYLRSSESVDYAKNYLKCEVGFVPDMAFLMPVDSTKIHKKKIVAVDFRIIEGLHDVILKDLKNIVRGFVKEGYAIELFYQVKGDQSYVEKLYQNLKQDGVTLRKDIVWFDDLDYYADKAFVVSNRLHTLLFGAVYGAIPIARIVNDPRLSKIEHVFKSSFDSVFCSSLDVNCPIFIKELVCSYESLAPHLAKNVKNNALMIRTLISEEINSLK